MLYTMKESLKMTKESQFAIPVFNACGYDMIKAIIEEAEGLEAPVTLEIHPDETAYLSDEFVAAVRAYAYTSKLPIVICLDHGDTAENILRAVRNGYSPAVIDASLKSFDDNVQITKRVVALAHAVGVPVEAELGTIRNNGSAERGAETIIYTDSGQTRIFMKEARIGTPTIAIGMAHGLYPKNRAPELNIDLLKGLNQQIDLLFALYGGSGNPDVKANEAVRYRVTKVNLSSDLKSIFFNALKKVLSENPSMYEPNAIYPAANRKVQEVAKHKTEILNTVGKASLY